MRYLTRVARLFRVRRCVHTEQQVFTKRLLSHGHVLRSATQNVPDSKCGGYIELNGVWPKHEMNLLLKHMRVYPNFITAVEEKDLLQELEPYLARMRYEYDHWDDAIHGYRETERKQWYPKSREVLNRVQTSAFDGQVMPYVHVLDLAKEGVIKPHVDSTRYCGNTIAGLSLLTDSVMRLVRTNELKFKQLPASIGNECEYRRQPKDLDERDYFADVLLPRRSLYVMTETARYNFTHEILSNEYSTFHGQHVPKGRRVSIICRNNPNLLK